MLESISPQDPRGRRLRWLLVVVAALILAVAAALLLRQPPDGDGGGGGGAPGLRGKKNAYENRGVFRDSPIKAPASVPIQGRVYDVQGNPVAGARVTASTFQVAGNQATPAGRAESNGDGRFEVQVADGSYHLTVEREGFGPAMVTAHGGDDVGVVLLRSGVVSGRVRDADQRPVPRFAIDVLSPAMDDMAAPAPFASVRITSPDGSYRIEQLPDRPVYLRVTAEGHAPAFSDVVKVRAGDSRQVDFTLAAGCTVTGIVVDSQGEPLANVHVDSELRKAAGVMGTSSIDTASADETDETGSFELAHVPLGDVMIRAYDGAHAVTTSDLALDGCADLPIITLRMTDGGALSGAVRDTQGKPVPGVKITVSHRAIGFVNTTSDADGRYRLDKLPAGGLRVTARRGDQHVQVLVTLREGESAQKDIPLSLGGTGVIEGKVTASGKPLAGMMLTIVSNEGGGVLGSRHPVTGPDGTFRAQGLSDGAYAVLVSSVNRVAQANIEKGSTVKLDLDVAAERKPPPALPDVAPEKSREKDD